MKIQVGFIELSKLVSLIRIIPSAYLYQWIVPKTYQFLSLEQQNQLIYKEVLRGRGTITKFSSNEVTIITPYLHLQHYLFKFPKVTSRTPCISRISERGGGGSGCSKLYGGAAPHSPL